jgi:hypothetical protein
VQEFVIEAKVRQLELLHREQQTPELAQIFLTGINLTFCRYVITICLTTWCHNIEDHNVNFHCHESLITHMIIVYRLVVEVMVNFFTHMHIVCALRDNAQKHYQTAGSI